MGVSEPPIPGAPPGDRLPAALVVEDDADVRSLLSAHLERRGWQVLAVATGEDALELAARRPPDLAVVDVVLPGIDGVEVVRALRAAPATARCCLVLTTMLDRDTLDDLGADATLPKPFTRKDVDGVLDSLVLERHP